jgi:hypothetical protein
MRYKDGESILIRFPQPGNSRFPEEKVLKEVAIMRFIAKHTLIPVPSVLSYGMAAGSPGGLGPFIVMEHIKHTQTICCALRKPGFIPYESPILDSNISDTKLRFIYGQMADVLLRLSQPSFSAIGAIASDDDGNWSVTGRPMTFSMNELVALGNFSPARLPSTTYTTATAYFTALAETHLAHLSTQRNDAIDSADDCREKYVARLLFRKLAREGRFASAHDDGNKKPFRLFCDDLRPGNVLADAEDRVVGGIDWEFAYAAPAEFTYSPPWWLLLEMPENWPGGIADWVRIYEGRLETFLEVMREREDVMIGDGSLVEGERLAGKMRESWETGHFWVRYVARKCWALDSLFWEYINPRFFGDSKGWEDRLELLSQEERDEMEEFVQRTMKDAETRVLDDWDDGVERLAHDK